MIGVVASLEKVSTKVCYIAIGKDFFDWFSIWVKRIGALNCKREKEN